MYKHRGRGRSYDAGLFDHDTGTDFALEDSSIEMRFAKYSIRQAAGSQDLKIDAI